MRSLEFFHGNYFWVNPLVLWAQQTKLHSLSWYWWQQTDIRSSELENTLFTEPLTVQTELNLTSLLIDVDDLEQTHKVLGTWQLRPKHPDQRRFIHSLSGLWALFAGELIGGFFGTRLHVQTCECQQKQKCRGVKRNLGFWANCFVIIH